MTSFRFCEDCGWEIIPQTQQCRGCGTPVTSPQDYWSPTIVDLTAWFDRREFWFAHLQFSWLDFERFLDDLSVPLASVYEMFAELWQERIWPTAEIPLRGGYSVAFVYFDYPEDADGPIYFDHPTWPEPICLGRCGGNCQLPALRDEELELLSRSAFDTSLPPWQIYLLFLPGALRPELPAALIEAVGHISDLPADRIAAVVHSQYNRPSQFSWSHNGSHWVHNCQHSLRNPAESGYCLTPAEFDRIEAMFTELFEAIK